MVGVVLADGARLWTSVRGANEGDAEPVILLNGGPGLADYLQPLEALLAPKFSVYRYEQRGCGRSERRGPYRLQRFVQDIEELRAHWGVPRWSVVGHSWGVDLGLAYAMAYPHSIARLVGVAGGRVVDDRSWSARYRAHRAGEKLPASAGEPNLLVNRSLSSEWKTYCKRPELLRDLAALEVETLFVTAARDIRPSWPTQQLACLLPNARIEEIRDADHTPWVDAGARLGNVLNRFLAAPVVGRGPAL